MIVIRCSDALHSTRSGEKDWSASQGTGTVDNGGHLCDACARLRFADSVSDTSDGRNEWVVYFNGEMSMTVTRRYPSGEDVSSKTKTGKLRDVFTGPQITTMKNKMKAWFIE